jgi:FtsP/CotA-like multicopper oxidase with cupredoxin domain
MWEMATNLTEVLGLLLVLAWTISAYRAGRLVFRPSRARLRRSARTTLALLGFDLLVLLAQLVLVALTWAHGWVFVENRVVLAVPPILAAAVVVVVWSVPRLWRLGRAAPADPDAPVAAAGRSAAAEPRLVVPVQAAAIGGLLDFWVVFVARPAGPFLMEAIAGWTVLLPGAALLWRRQRRRQRLLGGPEPRQRPGLGLRGLRALAVLAVIGAVLAVWVDYSVRASELPDRLSMNSMANVDWGGGPVGTQRDRTAMGTPGMDMPSPTSVADLTGPRDGTPDVRYTLTARQKRIRLSSGAVVDALTFNGQVPGPRLLAHQGDLVQVTLVNQLPGEGVTVHWHGLDVPNAEDGVAGVTQDAVQPGQRYVYRFRAEQVGSFWYHSHQASSEEVGRGLFGPLAILPKGAGDGGAAVDLPVMAHAWPTANGVRVAFGTSDTLRRMAVPAGTPVRLRLVNTSDNTTWGEADKQPRTLTFGGVPFKVAAIDGTEVNQPSELESARIPMGIGGRYDLTFTMPDHPVRLTDLGNLAAGLLLSPDGHGDAAPVPADAPSFDPARYGRPAPTPFAAASRFDRRFRLVLDDGPAFFDGRFGALPKVNGHVFPDTPMLMVRKGDLVETTVVNRGHLDHPMHLHGHHVLVLSRNGRPVSGSPWWADTVEILPGETVEFAFRADNPGVWMDHCHNLEHAAVGMVLHLGYDGVVSPYQVGRATANRPE